MKLVITGVGVVTAAGRGLDPLLRLLASGGDALVDQPPYAAEGLSCPRCASAPGLERQRPGEALLVDAAAQALAGAGVARPAAVAGLGIGTSRGNISGPCERWPRARPVRPPPSEA